MDVKKGTIKMEFIKKYYKYIIIFIMGTFIGLMINIPSCTQPKTEYIEIHDTINKERIVNNTQIKIKQDTTFIIDSILIKGDTIYVTTPIEYKVYKDTIKSDSLSTYIEINHHGIYSEIDNVLLSSKYKNTSIIEEKKRISPFIGISVGPIMTPTFKEVNGAGIDAEAGIIFKNGWGLKAEYGVDAFNIGMNHEVKLGVIKQF